MLATELHTEISATVQHVEISKDGHLDLNASEHMSRVLSLRCQRRKL